MKQFFRQPIDDVMTCLERVMMPQQSQAGPGAAPAGKRAPASAPPPKRAESAVSDSTSASKSTPVYSNPVVPVAKRGGARPPVGVMVVVLISLAVTWFIYVPIHELLHVAGCHVAGGEVHRLELSARYGGGLLSHIFPFVVSGSDYAGQVTGFDTKGSDWIYLATDFGPFVLTILFGVPMLKLAGRKRRPVLFGAAIVVGLAPFYNLPGDYYEMGSITTTRIVTVFAGSPPMEETERLAELLADPDAEPSELLPFILQSNARFARIRSDDIFTLMGNLVEKPGELGLTTPWLIVVGVLLAIISMVLAVLLAFATYWAGDQFAHRVLRMRRIPSPLST